MKELVPHYLQESGKERLDYLEDGKNIFKLRLRLCSSLYPVNECIRFFFLEYDRHTLRTSPPWGSELLEAINSLKNVDSTALLQFLYPSLNMLLHLIGNGGETLQMCTSLIENLDAVSAKYAAYGDSAAVPRGLKEMEKADKRNSTLLCLHPTEDQQQEMAWQSILLIIMRSDHDGEDGHMKNQLIVQFHKAKTQMS